MFQNSYSLESMQMAAFESPQMDHAGHKAYFEQILKFLIHISQCCHNLKNYSKN